jgi:hypothetical protein
VAFEDARHAVTHRRATVTPVGDLEIYDEARQVTDTLASAELENFAAAVHAVAELVMLGRDDGRRIGIAAWHLNNLRPRHGLADVRAVDPNAGRRVLVADLEPIGDGQVRIDLTAVRKAVEEQAPSFWDLQFHLHDRVFVGQWDDIAHSDADSIEFHPAAPPEWLAEQLP